MITRNRKVDIRIYFADNPSPLDISNVCHIGTEGGLLRVAYNDGNTPETIETQWWPLAHVFNIRLVKKTETA